MQGRARCRQTSSPARGSGSKRLSNVDFSSCEVVGDSTCRWAASSERSSLVPSGIVINASTVFFLRRNLIFLNGRILDMGNLPNGDNELLVAQTVSIIKRPYQIVNAEWSDNVLAHHKMHHRKGSLRALDARQAGLVCYEIYSAAFWACAVRGIGYQKTAGSTVEFGTVAGDVLRADGRREKFHTGRGR